MRVFFRYALREAGVNLWRNRIMTMAAVLTVAVSLLLVGGALLFKQSAAQASAVWEQQTRVTVWVQATAPTSEIQAIGSQLERLPYVKHPCTYRDQQQDYEAAKLTIPESVFQYLKPSQVPSSYLCEPVVPTDVSVVISTFTGEPGVYEVTAPVKAVERQEHDLHTLQWVLIGLALVLLVSAVVLILNTIRLAIYSRRREVTVMKLVGATNWFIRIPFVTEGFVQGLLGSVVAALGVTALHTWYPLSQEFRLSDHDLIGSIVVVVVLGVVIGSLGSAVAIRRFLDV